MSKTIKARLPRLPDPAFFRDSERTMATSDGGALVSYDPETRAGFLYVVAEGFWSISAPVDFPMFAALLDASGYSFPATPEVRAWVDRCLAGAADDFVH